MISKADKVIRKIQEKNRTYQIQLTGKEENEVNGFYILMISQSLGCFKGDKDESIYYGIKRETLDLLKEAGIKYKIEK